MEAVGGVILGTRHAPPEVVPAGRECVVIPNGARDTRTGARTTDARGRGGSPLWECVNFGSFTAGILLAKHERPTQAKTRTTGAAPSICRGGPDGTTGHGYCRALPHHHSPCAGLDDSRTARMCSRLEEIGVRRFSEHFREREGTLPRGEFGRAKLNETSKTSTTQV